MTQYGEKDLLIVYAFYLKSASAEQKKIRRILSILRED